LGQLGDFGTYIGTQKSALATSRQLGDLKFLFGVIGRFQKILKSFNYFV